MARRGLVRGWPLGLVEAVSKAAVLGRRVGTRGLEESSGAAGGRMFPGGRSGREGAWCPVPGSVCGARWPAAARPFRPAEGGAFVTGGARRWENRHEARAGRETGRGGVKASIDASILGIAAVQAVFCGDSHVG